jgi:hypothetical protein
MTIITDLIYNYYYNKFMKENSKSENNINWVKLERLINCVKNSVDKINKLTKER